MDEIHLSCTKEQTLSFIRPFCVRIVSVRRSYYNFVLFYIIFLPNLFLWFAKIHAKMCDVRYETKYYIILCFIARFLFEIANFRISIFRIN